jgi:hypothetical protein
MWTRRLLLNVVGGALVLAISFFGTLFILDYSGGDNRAARDRLRAEHAKLLKAGLEKYRGARGKYPAPFGNSPTADLKATLVGGGFLSALPQDPLWALTENQYRYVSVDGTTYGLLFHLELPSGKISAGGKCLTGVGTARTDWWGQPPDCPF